MQRKAVIAIGLTVCLITASASGYIMYRQQHTEQSNQLSNSAHSSTEDSNPSGTDQKTPSESATESIAETMAEEPEAPREPATDPTDAADQPQSSSRPATEPASTPNDDKIDNKTRRRATDAIERILDRARSYQPRSNQDCKKVTTPAIHRASGVRYNFKHDCLPKGWVKVSERRGIGR